MPWAVTPTTDAYGDHTSTEPRKQCKLWEGKETEGKQRNKNKVKALWRLSTHHYV